MLNPATWLVSLVIALAITSPALAKDFSAILRSGLKSELQEGQGNFNGTKAKILVVTGFKSAETLNAKLEAVFKGKGTVIWTSSPYGDVMTIVDIRSEGCPGCANVDGDAYLKAFENGFVISVIANESNVLGIATPGRVAAPAQGKLVYLGSALSNSAAKAKLVASTAMKFGTGETVSFTGTTDESVDQAFARIEGELLAAGYKKLNPLQPSGPDAKEGMVITAEHRRGFWTNGSHAVRAEVVATKKPNQSLVNVNEVTSQ